MSVRPTEALRTLLELHSDALIQDRARLSSLLHDLSPSHVSERRLLDAAVEHRIAHDLSNKRGVPLSPAERDQLVRRMATQSMLQETHCAWAVDGWAYALDRTGGTAPGAAFMTPSIDLTADRSSIREGEEAVLRWHVVNADRVTLIPDGHTVAPVRERRVKPERSTTYTIRAESGDLMVESSVHVEVIEVADASRPRRWKTAAAVLLALPILALAAWQVWRAAAPEADGVTFTISPETLEVPANVVISWTAPAGARVEAMPGDDCTHRGDHMICAVSTTTVFTLTVWDGDIKLTERAIEIPVGPRR